ncbi:4-oxalomesaconate tautomerase [Leucothrix pacifica]|uniref:4-oxalomesaconate tautomerase n=1 Tax=Leucothrix pacifica TaxID=1247513 RepID=A0A317CGJ2_9GAMM|nr:4-oxalomesaconate tautomerase [Leucothrix pacifica]PWQ97675.1 4-oxalomesaconate tautomerase [Leucothrix pacifica]
MAEQIAIPCIFMRGGTSKGPFFNRNHLPDDLDRLAEVLIAAVGSGHALNIDGIGGGAAVTTKVVMISPSDHEWADVDYFFAQVNVLEQRVDFSPTCGNMLAGVGPAAITMGLVKPKAATTAVKIRSVNTGALVEAIVQTPGAPIPSVQYDGDARIDGVPGTAAPILLKFMGVVGSKTGALFPTDKAQEQIDNIDVTLIDAAVPMMMVRAQDLGLSGHEAAADIDKMTEVTDRMEVMRIEAGERMGLGDVTEKVVPKMALLSAPNAEGTIAARYFMPWSCHPSMAVTGGICIASCVLAPGTIAAGLERLNPENPGHIVIEHPMGQMDVLVDYKIEGGQFELVSAGIVRTARLLMRGDIMIPSSVWV